MIEFTWKIESVDNLSNTMVVEYSSGNKSQRLSIPQPSQSQDLTQWINQYAPVDYLAQPAYAEIVVGTTGSGSALPPVPPAPLPPVISAIEFMNKFTYDEKLAITALGLTDPEVRLWYDQLIVSLSVSVSDPRVMAGVANLVTAGVLTQARADEILAA